MIALVFIFGAVNLVVVLAARLVVTRLSGMRGAGILPMFPAYRLAERGKRIPAIALSGFGAASDIEKSKAAGFVEHITKPVDFASLKAAVARHC